MLRFIISETTYSILIIMTNFFFFFLAHYTFAFVIKRRIHLESAKYKINVSMLVDVTQNILKSTIQKSLYSKT